MLRPMTAHSVAIVGVQEEQRELANTIRVSGSMLLATVSNFLDFFKMEAGKQLDIVRSEVRLDEMVQDVTCIIEAMLGRSGDVTLMEPELHDVPEVSTPVSCKGCVSS
jgi:signal transduction histidine kinase